jgi:hypothetical protein
MGMSGLSKSLTLSLLAQKAKKSDIETWDYFALNWDEAPTLITDNVYEYTLKGVTRYRYVPSTYDPTLDAFFANWDGENVSDLIVARSL